MKYYPFILGFASIAALGTAARGSTIIYTDQFTLASEDLPYGQVYGTIPTSVAPTDTTAIKWARTGRTNFPGNFRITDAGGTHGGVLQPDNSLTQQSINYITNIDLTKTEPFLNSEGKEVYWSMTFDLNRNGTTPNWISFLANYDDTTHEGIVLTFAFGAGKITVSETTTSDSIGNPGLVLGSGGLWGSFIFERYTDGTIRIAKTSGGQSGAVGNLDLTLVLSNPNFTTGGTFGIGFQSQSTATNPIYVDNLAITLAQIPESTTLALLGLAGLVWYASSSLTKSKANSRIL